MSRLNNIFLKYKNTSAFYFVIATLVIITVIIIELYFFIPLNKNINKEQNVNEIYFAANISPDHKKIIDKFILVTFSADPCVLLHLLDLPFRSFQTVLDYQPHYRLLLLLVVHLI